MRTLLIGIAFVVGVGPTALAQTAPRFSIGVVGRLDKVGVEAGLETAMPVVGIATSARLSKTFGIDAEITNTSRREFARSYEGISQSFAEPNSSLAEIERLGVRTRTRYGYIPGLGWSVAMTGRAGLTGPADIVLRLGLAARSYTETYENTVLSIPAGIDPRRLAIFSRGDGTGAGPNDAPLKTQRGGLLMGLAVPVRVTRRLSVTPDVRYVYGGPAQIGHKHREVSLGVRAGWAL